MKLVRNPSYTHAFEIKNKFNQYKDIIFMKDHTQYTQDHIKTLLKMIEEAKKIGMKKDHLLWLTTQIWTDKVDSEERAKEDYLSLVKAHFLNQSLLNPIDSYMNVSELNMAIESIAESDEVVLEKEYDLFYERDGWFVAMPHTTKASCILGKGTDWCTARTKSQNLFLSYVGRHDDNIILFYLIKINGNTMSNPNDKLSVGFHNEFVFNSGDGGLTVNAANKGISKYKFFSILGYELANDFLDKMKEKAESLKGKHPAKKEMEKISKSVRLFKKKTEEFKNEKEEEDFLGQLAKYPTLSEEIQMEIFNRYKHPLEIKKPAHLSYVLHSLLQNEKLSEKIQSIITERLFNTTGISEGCEQYSLAAFFLSRNIGISEDTQMGLLGLMHETIWSTLAENKSLVEEAQMFLLKRKHSLNLLAQNLSITERVQLMLLEESEYTRQTLAHNENLSEEMKKILATDSSEDVREQLALRNDLPDEALIVLANDKSDRVKDFVAGMWKLPEEAQLILASDKNWKIRASLAHHSVGPREGQVKKLTKKVQNIFLEEDNINVLRVFAVNPSISEGTMLKLIEREEIEIRVFLASNLALTEKIQIILANDNTKEVLVELRGNIAISNNVRQFVLARLADEFYVIY